MPSIGIFRRAQQCYRHMAFFKCPTINAINRHFEKCIKMLSSNGIMKPAKQLVMSSNVTCFGKGEPDIILGEHLNNFCNLFFKKAFAKSDQIVASKPFLSDLLSQRGIKLIAISPSHCCCCWLVWSSEVGNCDVTAVNHTPPKSSCRVREVR